MSWDKRYDREDYLFGTEPADFLRRHAGRLPPESRVLVIADGEGRNSVYLAGLGHKVTAFDASPVALEKAHRLASDKGVTVAFHEADIFEHPWDRETYDAVVGVFFQFMGPEDRAGIFAGMNQALRPGGLMLIHGYAPRQVEYRTGGPPAAENMYTIDLLRGAFPDHETLVLVDQDIMIDEGTGHSGRSAVVDYVARKDDATE